MYGTGAHGAAPRYNQLERKVQSLLPSELKWRASPRRTTASAKAVVPVLETYPPALCLNSSIKHLVREGKCRNPQIAVSVISLIS